MRRVITKLKSDIETAGEVDLAIRELSELAANALVRNASLHEVNENTQIDKDDSKARFLFTDVDEGLDELTTRLDRLAYAEWYVCDRSQKRIPQQAEIERRSTESSGRVNASRRDREYLSHAIHKYKAKFFPRFARALINICAPESTCTVLDPFCGSGTTALETGLMGLHSVSNDIDPLSCLITKGKVLFPLLPSSELDEVVRSVTVRGDIKQAQLFESNSTLPLNYRIPGFLRSKLPEDIAKALERDVSYLAARVGELPNERTRLIASLMISHAISTKISLRWVGTGDNRFALELAARDVFNILSNHIKRLQSNHPSAIGFTLPATAQKALITSRFHNSSADNIDLDSESVDAVVTSPPYLPASSGRETYLRSRAPGLIALDLLSEDQIHRLDATHIVGSVLRTSQRTQNGLILPDAVLQLVEWMRPQRARGPKSEATLVYFHDLAKIAKEMHRVLRPSGRMAMVVCTSHSFYELVSREIVRRFPLAEILADFFTNPRYDIGFKSVESIQIELPKMDFRARPGSRHTYSETALIFSKG